jgi:hypothetical protein
VLDRLAIRVLVVVVADVFFADVEEVEQIADRGAVGWGVGVAFKAQPG